MKIFYATSIAYPSKLANPEQIVATVSAIDGEIPGCVTLGLSKLEAKLSFSHKVFEGTKRSPILGLRHALYARREKFTHIYCREDRLLLFIMLWSSLLGFHPRFFFEAHTMHDGFAFSWLRGRVDGLIAITNGLYEDLRMLGSKPQQMLVAPDGVDLEEFSHPEPQSEARKRLGIPKQAKVAMYIGQLGGWKGVGTFLEASKLLPEMCATVIGGEPQQVEALRTSYPEVRFVGRRPYHELVHNQAAADVLVLPNTARDLTSVRYTSPMKLFSYMASGRPIVASDLPSIREIVTDEEVFFFKADDSSNLASVIRLALEDEQVASLKAARARKKVESYTWQCRARLILEFLSKNRQ